MSYVYAPRLYPIPEREYKSQIDWDLDEIALQFRNYIREACHWENAPSTSLLFRSFLHDKHDHIKFSTYQDLNVVKLFEWAADDFGDNLTVVPIEEDKLETRTF